jgi:putative ABC transport system substrate-binding protein
VIAAQDTPSAMAAKAATTAIPIVFVSGADPVKLGLVPSLNRPGGNGTGVTFVAAELGAKQLGLLHELQPETARVGVLVDPNYPATASFISDVQAAASSIRKQVEVIEAPDAAPVRMGVRWSRLDHLRTHRRRNASGMNSGRTPLGMENVSMFMAGR